MPFLFVIFSNVPRHIKFFFFRGTFSCYSIFLLLFLLINFSLMYPDILIYSFSGVLFPVIQLFCDLFFLFFTLNVPRNLHFFIYWGISFFYKNFMLYFIVLFLPIPYPKIFYFCYYGVHHHNKYNIQASLWCFSLHPYIICYFFIVFSSVKNHNNCCGCFTFPTKKASHTLQYEKLS